MALVFLLTLLAFLTGLLFGTHKLEPWEASGLLAVAIVGQAVTAAILGDKEKK